jgi:cytochrome b561/polyisoprenoid-binding protein YceI
MEGRAQRYTAVAIVLHWAIAASLLFLLPLGFIMHIRTDDGDASQALFSAYQLHKSIGLTVLALTLVRLAWRLMNPPPPLPAHMPGWEKFAARATHWAFYALTILLPLSGWLYVSAGWSIHSDTSLAVTTRWFGLFEVPALFGLPQQSADVRADTAEAAFTAHWVLAYVAIGLAVLHVAAALKHHFFDRDETLAHMVPGVKVPNETAPAPRSLGRGIVLGAGLAAIAVGLVLAVSSVAELAAPVQAPSSFEVTESAETPAAPDAGLVAPETSVPATPGAPSAWTVDQSASSIGFTYVYEDESGETSFNGRFTRWRADIRFDPNNLDASSVVVRITTASAQTGVQAHDAALPTEEWFNSSEHPTAIFRSTRIRARSGGSYEARGALTIRGATRDVDLPFTLTINGDRASVSGSTTIDRRDFNIGTEGSGDDLISREITINVRVDAQRAS